MAEEPTAPVERESEGKSKLWKGVVAVTGIMTTLVIYGVLQVSNIASSK